VNDEMERMWKELVAACFEILSLHLPGVTQGDHEEPQSGQPVSRPRFETETFEYEENILTIQQQLSVQCS